MTISLPLLVPVLELPLHLANRRIVIDDHLRLLPCRGSAAGKRARGDFTVFFRPGSTVDDEGDDAPGDLELPTSLEARLAFPHSSLRWLEVTPQGRVNRPGRDLLEDAGVRQWRLEDLYPEVGALVRLESGRARVGRCLAVRLRGISADPPVASNRRDPCEPLRTDSRRIMEAGPRRPIREGLARGNTRSRPRIVRRTGRGRPGDRTAAGLACSLPSTAGGIAAPPRSGLRS